MVQGGVRSRARVFKIGRERSHLERRLDELGGLT